MAEGIDVHEQVQEVQSGGVPADIAQLMELSLNGGVAQQQEPQQPAQQQEPTQTQEPVVQTDSFAPFKEKFGYQSPEDAIKEIEELRVLKASPAQVLKFENEQSEKLFTAIQKGEHNKVLEILSQQERLDSLTKAEVNGDNAEAIIKLAMSIENSSLSKDEIDFQFKQNYSLPKPPKEIKQRDTEDDEEFAERKADYDDALATWKELETNIAMKKSIAAKMAIPKLEAAKSKIVLPEFEDEVDEGYAQYLKVLEDRQKAEPEIQAEYGTFTPKTIEQKVKFIDEANKIDFEFQFEPDSESFNQAREMALDINKFFNSFKSADGKPDRKGFLEALYFGLNRTKVITEAIKQGKNAAIKASLPDNSGGPQRQFPQTQEPSELDKLMQASLNPYSRTR